MSTVITVTEVIQPVSVTVQQVNQPIQITATQMGIQGQKGDPGTGINILGSFDNESELPETGETGDAYLINGDLYVWTGVDYQNVGNIQGPQGPAGSGSVANFDTNSFDWDELNPISETNKVKILEALQVDPDNHGFVRSSTVNSFMDSLGLVGYLPTLHPKEFVLLDADRVHGSFATPYTGDIRFYYAGMKVGASGVIIHKSTTAPDFPKIFKGTGTYSTSLYNLIFYRVISERNITYQLFQYANGLDANPLNLVLNYKFEMLDNELEYPDSSIYGNTGTFSGNIARRTFVKGVLGSGLYSDPENTGSSTSRGGITIPSSLSLQSVEAFTVAFWFFLPAGQTATNILRNAITTAANGFEINSTSTRRLEVILNRFTNGTTLQYRTSNEALTDGGWTYCVIRRNGANLNMRTTKLTAGEWVSSQVFNSTTASSDIIGGNQAWHVFQTAPATGQSRGILEDLRVYNRWLTDTEVSQLETI